MARIHGGARRWKAAAAALACGAVLLAGCESSSTEVEGERTFLVSVGNEQFRVRASDPAAVAALEARRKSGEVGVVMGTVVQGDGGFNSPWGWHLDPASIEVPDASIELCDGLPSMVQEDIAQWIADVRTFCPWSAKVVKAE